MHLIKKPIHKNGYRDKRGYIKIICQDIPQHRMRLFLHAPPEYAEIPLTQLHIRVRSHLANTQLASFQLSAREVPEILAQVCILFVNLEFVFMGVITDQYAQLRNQHSTNVAAPLFFLILSTYELNTRFMYYWQLTMVINNMRQRMDMSFVIKIVNIVWKTCKRITIIVNSPNKYV